MLVMPLGVALQLSGTFTTIICPSPFPSARIGHLGTRPFLPLAHELERITAHGTHPDLQAEGLAGPRPHVRAVLPSHETIFRKPARFGPRQPGSQL